MNLLGRVAKVTIIGLVPRADSFVSNNPQFFQVQGNAVEITNLRIRFGVEKNHSREPNKCTIKISNLSEDFRDELEQGRLQAMLHAGYDDGYRLLFMGDIFDGYTQREGSTEIVTTLRVGDGLKAFSHARVNRSYKPPYKPLQILSDAAKSMGLRLPPEIERAPELRRALAVGISTHGPARDVLTRLLSPYGYSWSVQNGRLSILKDEQVSTTQAALISQPQGLIGIPEPSQKKAKRVAKAGSKPKPREVKFKTLLYPELVPGGLAKLEAEFLNLLLKITEVTHEGDTHGPDFTTSVSGVIRS